MRRISLIVLTAFSLSSCGGGGNSASKLANEVCDCYSKANAMDASDPKRAEAQNACVTKQGEAWEKLKNDEKKSAEFNTIIGNCSKELIKKSLGQ